ncbi:MAG: L,D-transpeptidase family protein [Bacteroidetes bacterium]|nr:L,D-transpeptidase family protein [Bacteroidota bacterium]
MKTIVKLIILTLILSAFTLQGDFLSDQKRYKRVRTAIKEKGETVEKKLKDKGLEIDNTNILLVAYKDNDELEIYARKKTDTVYRKLISYKICSRSGQLGPKRKQGDYQVPEGFYHIDRFNPTSKFYLSLGLNYPNQSDRRKSKASNLGGDIFIHGSCVTIGCLPMTTLKIKEIYLYAVYAKNNGQARIPVYIFPFKMTDQNFNRYKTKHKDNKDLIDFWSNIKTGYDKFMKEKTEIKFRVDSNGDYTF